MKITAKYITLAFGLCIALWIASLALVYFNSNNLEQFARLGDSFGAVNALFSGLAFGGLIVTLILQRSEINQRSFEQRFFALLEHNRRAAAAIRFQGKQGAEAFSAIVAFLKTFATKEASICSVTLTMSVTELIDKTNLAQFNLKDPLSVPHIIAYLDNTASLVRCALDGESQFGKGYLVTVRSQLSGDERVFLKNFLAVFHDSKNISADGHLSNVDFENLERIFQ
jgi:hypothetical protein